jgi:hypothetical protein
MTAEREDARDDLVFAWRARADGSCVVRGQVQSFSFEVVAPVSGEAQAMAERWRQWVVEVR